MACLGQLRYAPSGHVVGIEMNTAMQIVEVRGCSLGVASELLQAAEAGLVEALQPSEAAVKRTNSTSL